MEKLGRHHLNQVIEVNVNKKLTAVRHIDFTYLHPEGTASLLWYIYHM